MNTIRKSLPKIEEVNSSTNLYAGFGRGMTVSNAKRFTVYSFTFNLTKVELQMLAESVIEVIRIPDTEELKFVDLKANRKRTKKKIKAIYKGANCLSSHL